jgi:hypothetical protein
MIVLHYLLSLCHQSVLILLLMLATSSSAQPNVPQRTLQHSQRRQEVQRAVAGAPVPRLPLLAWP